MRASDLNRRSILALGAGAVALAACNRGATAGAGAQAMTLGRADAPVSVIEYASVTCGVCAAWDREVWPAFKQKYVDTNLVRYELREMLTPPTEVAAAGFLIARCAGREKYFDVVHALFRTQRILAETQDARGWLLNTAKSAGMTEQQFEACVADDEALVALNDRVEAAVRAGVEGTPTFVIGEEKLVGNVPLARLDAVIQPLLKQRRTG